jgi:alpha-1,3-rhamnosyl/mannosyltransferase
MFESKFEATLARASHILTDCEYIRHELADWFGLSLEKISSVYLGVGANYRPHTLTELTPMLRKYGVDQTGYLLSVATYEPRKRVIAAIEAHRHLRERQQIPPLLLVGAPGWNNEELTNRIDEATRRGDVISLGHVAEEELPLIYAGASLFLFPSIYEGFGLPPIEAMACGVPTIVSDRACLPEVTRGAAMLINPDDLEGFSAAIERGLVDDRWRAQAIEAGQQVAAGYTWKRCSEETIDVYQRIWAENGRPN